MKRKIYENLLSWKNNEENKKPLIVLGARQVGKTFIVNEFCKNEYKNYVYVNLLEEKQVINLYKEDINSEERYQRLKILINLDLDLEDTILFVDEVQESEKFISELKFLCEKHNNVRVICAGSLLGVKLKRDNVNFPVGKVKMITLYPLDFEEFLLALNENILVQEIQKCYYNNKSIGDALHAKCINYYKIYNITGGMPESIKNMIVNNLEYIKFDRSIIGDIINSYFKDMDKYVLNKNEVLKNERIYDSIPSQISNESSRFQFSKVASGARLRDYENSLDWLMASNIIYKSNLVSLPQVPLKGFEKYEVFKLFYNDIGLLNYALNINMYDILADNLSLYKGAIAENYVANQLVFNNQKLYFYKDDNNNIEVDFLIYNDDGIIPLEVKAGKSTKSISLNKYIQSFKPKYAIKISAKNFGYDKISKIKFIPLYAVFCIK